MCSVTAKDKTHNLVFISSQSFTIDESIPSGYFFKDYFGAFFAFIVIETAEDMTGKGAEREGMTRSKWVTGGIRTCDHCRGLTASIHGTPALPTEL